jgi:hypothetical protein
VFILPVSASDGGKDDLLLKDAGSSGGAHRRTARDGLTQLRAIRVQQRFEFRDLGLQPTDSLFEVRFRRALGR